MSQWVTTRRSEPWPYRLERREWVVDKNGRRTLEWFPLNGYHTKERAQFEVAAAEARGEVVRLVDASGAPL